MIQGSDMNPDSQTPTSPLTTKPAVLIIEDDIVLSKMYTEKFMIEGFHTLTASNGETGLRLALEEHIGVILLDIMLPRVSGIDFLETLRQSTKGKEIPVIALTNLAKDEERARAMELGVKEYLVKAMQTPEEVVETVKKYFPQDV